jgi:hypothetical protein
VVLVVLGLMVACTPEPTELQGIDLPPASMPDNFDLDVWAISFSREFEPGSWNAGSHTYSLNLDCPILFDEPVQTSERSFSVTPLARSFDHVYLRLNGVSATIVGPTGLFALRPDQPTTAAITVIGVAKENARDAASCAGEVKVDGGRAEPLIAGQPFRP